MKRTFITIEVVPSYESADPTSIGHDIAATMLDGARNYARRVYGAELKVSQVETRDETPCPGCGRRHSDPVGAGCQECAEPFPDAPADQASPKVTMGERLMPGCTCGAAAAGDFERCTCD